MKELIHNLLHGNTSSAQGTMPFRMSVTTVHVIELHLNFTADTDLGMHTQVVRTRLHINELENSATIEVSEAYPPLLAAVAAVELISEEAASHFPNKKTVLMWKVDKYSAKDTWSKLLEKAGWKKPEKESMSDYLSGVIYTK